jgi:16S rRNA (uracil1498-N3)-methyltransferase
MPRPRFFIAADIRTGQISTLPESASHHLARVLRLKIDSEIIIFNGQGGEFLCKIQKITDKQVEVLPVQFHPEDRAARLKIHLGLCIQKRDSMDRVITRAVELGVTSISPIASDYCTVAKKVINNRGPHWRKITLAACEQCGLNLLPELKANMSMEDWLVSQDSDARLIAVPDSHPIAVTGAIVDTVSLLIGPEGGFSSAEITAATRAEFEPITFGERILRAETAPIVALSVLHHIWGDF